MKNKKERKGFTLVELMVVILIVGILAAVAVPILRGKIDQAKWSEAAATAGAIRTALRAYYAEDSTKAVAMVGKTVDTVQTTLGFTSGDLTGRYFKASDFKIDSHEGNGNFVITVPTAPTGLSGTGKLDSTNGWVYTP